MASIRLSVTIRSIENRRPRLRFGVDPVNGRPRILAFAGSAREASYNKKLLTIAIEGANAAGADVTRIDLRDRDPGLIEEKLARVGEPLPGQRDRDVRPSTAADRLHPPKHRADRHRGRGDDRQNQQGEAG